MIHNCQAYRIRQVKRYRLFAFDFDFRANFLSIEPSPTWSDEQRARHVQQTQQILAGIKQQYGDANSDLKLKNFVDLGPKLMSVIVFHNHFFEQVRTSFVCGAYYPALVGVCALGERVLNHLVITFRDQFQDTKEYRLVSKKKSFDNWDRVLKVLHKWGCLRTETVEQYHELKTQRNAAVHFRPETDRNARHLALRAIKTFQRILELQFAGWEKTPWFIDGTPGETFIKQAWESDPFVEKIYLPSCRYVSFKHVVRSIEPRLMIDDSGCPVPALEVSDEEFARLRREFAAR